MKKYFSLLLFVLVANIVYGQLKPQSVSIPMRDNKSLAGDLYLPNGVDTFPTILIMTPYGKLFYRLSGLPFGIKRDISKSKYAILIVDWRCRFASMSACAAGSDNGEDGYDVVEWAAKQKWCTGKIGTWGPSALGNVQFSTAKQKPPHLTCAVPEVASPIFMYSKYHPGGSMEAATFKTLNEKLFPGSYDLVIKNPYYNILWQTVESSSTYLDQIEIPMLLIGGWYDHNIQQNLEIMEKFKTQAPVAVRDKHKILVGPWVHGGSGQASLGTSFQGDFSFPNAEKWNDSLSIVFFDYYLRGVDNGYASNPTYTYYQIGDNTWHTSSNWPPIRTDTMRLYLNASNALTKMKPISAGLSLMYTYDPTDPSPTIGGKTLHDSLLQGPYDQSTKVEGRSDVLLFTTETLKEDLVLLGGPKITLNVSSDKKDTDFVVRLTEVFPDGRSIQVGTMIQRMRFRNGRTKNDTAFMKPGEVYSITIPIEDIAYTFKAGNKIRIVVSSSNYPLYNRNMNTGEVMYPGNKVDSVHNPLTANNTIHFGSDAVSSIELPYVIKLDKVSKIKTKRVEIYPNPVKDVLNIQMKEKFKFKVFDVSGKVVLNSPNYKYQSVLNVKELQRGVYFLVVKSVFGGTRKTKFIKE